MAVTWWIGLSAMNTARASLRNRAPPHSAQTTSARKVSRRCRFVSLAVVANSFSSIIKMPSNLLPPP